MSDRLDALARPDKWYLGAGEGVVWAPPFPDHLDRPGFWDEAHVFHFPVRPLFTVALVDPGGRESPLEMIGRMWRPDRLTTRWSTADGVALVEERSVLEGARFGSVWRVEANGQPPDEGLRGAWLVAFTQFPEAGAVIESAGRTGLSWRRRIVHREPLATELGFDLVADGGPIRRFLIRSEGRETNRWAHTPFAEAWASDPDSDGPAPAVSQPDEAEARGRVHVAVGVSLGGDAGHPVSFTLRIRTPGYLMHARHGGSDDGGTRRTGVTVTDWIHAAVRPARPGEGEASWQQALEAFPRFRCSDPWLERYWDYRIYGLRLNRLGAGPAGYPHPAIAEGIEYFHWPISYSAQCHMLEMRWSGSPEAARGSLLNFLAAQRADGSIPGRLNLCPGAPDEPDFYHANWGDSVLAVDAVHPDAGFLDTAYDGLARYAQWLVSARDPEDSGMVTVTNHYETGQEYMSRYLAVDPAADTGEWEPRLTLKGVDATVYLQRLQSALSVMASRLDRPGEARDWAECAARTGRVICAEMWDPVSGFFSDVDAATMERTGVRAAVGFHPLLTDLLDGEQVDRLLDHLLDPAEFWTPWPVPSSPVDDAMFSAEGLWRGKRRNCPWNGRVWPMTNSHVVEGLLRQWRSGRRRAGTAAADLLSRFIRMMYADGDPDRPDCYEHYNPFTGRASEFRGIDDYQHSWVLDLLVRGVAGLDPDDWMGRGASPSSRNHGPLVIDPLPMGLDTVDLEGAFVRGMTVDIHIRGDHCTAVVDGREYGGTVGQPLSPG